MHEYTYIKVRKELPQYAAYYSKRAQILRCGTVHMYLYSSNNCTIYLVGGALHFFFLTFFVGTMVSVTLCSVTMHFCWDTLVLIHPALVVYCVRNVVAHGDAREGKWRGNWRMEWVASTLTRPRNVVYPALLTLMRTPRLPAVDWTDSPTDLNRLVCLGERRNVVSAHVPSGSARALSPSCVTEKTGLSKQ